MADGYKHVQAITEILEEQLNLYKKEEKQGVQLSRQRKGPSPLLVLKKDGTVVRSDHPLMVTDIIDKDNIAHVQFELHSSIAIELKAIIEPLSVFDIAHIGEWLA